MSREEKARRKIDRLTERIMTYGDARTGKTPTADEARKIAVDSANRTEKRKEG